MANVTFSSPLMPRDTGVRAVVREFVKEEAAARQRPSNITPA